MASLMPCRSSSPWRGCGVAVVSADVAIQDGTLLPVDQFDKVGDEMKAAVEVAHKYGKRVAIHSYGPDGARDAVSAGTDSLEHAIDIPDDVLAEMVKRGTFYVPTIDHNRYYVDAREEFKYDDKVVAGLNAYIEKNLETARRAHKAGVKFAMGSDAVFSMFGQNTRELGWFVKAGMTPQEALQTATTNAAALLGMSGQLGAIAPGYFADLVAVEGDPLKRYQGGD